jgi:hypothetical protein
MTVSISDYVGQTRLVAAQHLNHGKPESSVIAELTAIATALGADVTTHDCTIETPVAGMRIGADKTAFTNDALLLVNMAKGGGQPNDAIATAINSNLATIVPPQNTAAPVASGTGTVGQTLSVTNGTWNYSPTSYAYQWMRGGTNIFNATGAAYLLVAADSGTSVSCQVTASNPAGSTAIVSNAIAVA